LTSPISEESLAQEVEDGALLLATGFDDRQNAFDKTAAMLGLGAM
jgi:hypothetical protein